MKMWFYGALPASDCRRLTECFGPFLFIFWRVGSATSSDSGNGSGSSLPHPLGLGLTLGIGLGIGLGAELDAGYCTQFDSHSNSSSDVAPPPPPPLLHAPHGTTSASTSTSTNLNNHASSQQQSTESPPVAPRTRVPLFPIGAQGTSPSPHGILPLHPSGSLRFFLPALSWCWTTLLLRKSNTIPLFE
jgi:hypothetical protein